MGAKIITNAVLDFLLKVYDKPKAHSNCGGPVFRTKKPQPRNVIPGLRDPRITLNPKLYTLNPQP